MTPTLQSLSWKLNYRGLSTKVRSVFFLLLILVFLFSCKIDTERSSSLAAFKGTTPTSNKFSLSISKLGNGNVASSPAGINCGEDCTEEYTEDTNNEPSITLTATPETGYGFSSWIGCDSSDGNTCTVVINSNKTITANFEVLVTLVVNNSGGGTVDSSPDGISCGSACSKKFVSGKDVTLDASPDLGFEPFWIKCDILGIGSGSMNSGPCTVTMNSDQSTDVTFLTGTLPDTGQTTSYADATGDDGDYSSNPRSYTDNDPYITDNVTGRIWQKEDDGVKYSWSGAISHCNGLDLAGETDWRLPTKKELLRIVDSGRVNPAIDTGYFTNTKSSSYWCSTSSSNNGSIAWNVKFDFGLVSSNDSTSNLYYARCVRTGP